MLALITLLGLAIRLIYILGFRYPMVAGGDAFYYHAGANLLAEGRGFIQPMDYFQQHWTVQAAEHPPLYILYLAIPSVLGLKSVLAHQLATCLLGVATVVLMGFAGRRIVGPRAGLAAAFLAAAYPNFWANDALVLSETLAQLTTVIVILIAYRFWDRRDRAAALWLGVALGLVILSRAESVLLLVLLVVPLAVGMRSLRRRGRAGLVLTCWVAALLVVGPWVGYNLTRFEHPVTISTGLDPTLKSASCDAAWYGPGKGFWALACIKGHPRVARDLSSLGLVYRQESIDYIKAHLADLPGVVLAREGRTWGWYRPDQIPNLDNIADGRPKVPARIALWTLWVLEATSLVGAVVLRRRRVPISPLIALVVTVTITTAVTFGETRYRATAEPALVLLAVAGMDWLWRQGRQRIRRRPAARAEPVSLLAPGAVTARGVPVGAAPAPSPGSEGAAAPGEQGPEGAAEPEGAAGSQTPDRERDVVAAPDVG